MSRLGQFGVQRDNAEGTLSITDGNTCIARLSPQQAIDLARQLFTSALRLSSHTAHGRLSAGVAVRLMIRQTQDVAQEVRDGIGQ